MLSKFKEFSINEEVGMKKLAQIVKEHKEKHGKNFEIWFHQDADGIFSCLCMKKILEDYGLFMVDCHIIQYGGIEFAVKNKMPGSLACLVDFAHSSPMYIIHTDHHSSQSGVDKKSSNYFKPARSNAETISGEISHSDIFTDTDIELIKTVDSADFLRNKIKPEDIQKSIFSYDKSLSPTRNRFLMGLVVNRLLLAFKNKRITVESLDKKHKHTNKNLLECLAIDSKPSLYSLFNNLKHYIKDAVSLEWDRSLRKHNVPKKLATPEELAKNLESYIKTRKRSFVDDYGNEQSHKDIDYDEKYKIIKQYGIGSVFNTGAYDRYVVFKNFPEADFVCTIFPMGLIQVSCNPFKEKVLKEVNLGEISKEVLSKFKYQFSNINISISDVKRINEDEIAKMKTKYGDNYQAIGFTFNDLLAFYKDEIIYLPGRASGDMKTRAKLDLSDESKKEVASIKRCLNKPFDKWSREDREEMDWMRIPIWTLIEANSGGHPSITNITSLNYLSCRKDLITRLFKTDNYTDIMRLIADKFVECLQQKIDMIKSGQKVVYDIGDVKLGGEVLLENKKKA